MFAVHGQHGDLLFRRCAHDRFPARDQSLLVRERNVVARVYRRQSRLQAADTHERIERNVRLDARRFEHAFSARENGDGSQSGEFARPLLVFHGDEFGAEKLYLLFEQTNVSRADKRLDAIFVGIGGDDVERLRPYRTRTSEKNYLFHKLRQK